MDSSLLYYPGNSTKKQNKVNQDMNQQQVQKELWE